MRSGQKDRLGKEVTGTWRQGIIQSFPVNRKAFFAPCRVIEPE
jgi:hypothetical protein